MKKFSKFVGLAIVALVMSGVFVIPKYITKPKSDKKTEKKLTEKEIKKGKGLVSYEELSKDKNLTISQYLDIINKDKKNVDKLLSEKLNADEMFVLSSAFNMNKVMYDLLGHSSFDDIEALKDTDLYSLTKAINKNMKLAKAPIYHGDLSKIKTNDLFVRSVLMGENFFSDRKEEIKQTKRKIENCIILKDSEIEPNMIFKISLSGSEITTIQVGDFLKKCGYKDAKPSQPFYSFESKKNDNDDIKILEGNTGELLLSMIYHEDYGINKNWKRFPYSPDEMNAVIEYLQGRFEIPELNREDFLNDRSKLKLGDIVKYYNKNNIATPVIRDSDLEVKDYYYKDYKILEQMGYTNKEFTNKLQMCYYKIDNGNYLKYNLALNKNTKIGEILEICKKDLDNFEYGRFL